MDFLKMTEQEIKDQCSYKLKNRAYDYVKFMYPGHYYCNKNTQEFQYKIANKFHDKMVQQCFEYTKQKFLEQKNKN